jgi:hypothetical protein
MIHGASDIFLSTIGERVAMRLAAAQNGHLPSDARSADEAVRKAVKQKTRQAPDE